MQLSLFLRRFRGGVPTVLILAAISLVWYSARNRHCYESTLRSEPVVRAAAAEGLPIKPEMIADMPVLVHPSRYCSQCHLARSDRQRGELLTMLPR